MPGSYKVVWSHSTACRTDGRVDDAASPATTHPAILCSGSYQGRRP
jgi:hypothetical protein